MIKNRMKLLFILCVFFCLVFSLVLTGYGNDLPLSDKKIVIHDSGNLKDKVKNKKTFLNKELLKKLLPELKNPRLMTLKDLEDTEEQEIFKEEGYTFVLEGDFNKDGVPDIAFVGKYDNDKKPNENSFIAIISIKNNNITRELLNKLRTKQVSLTLAPAYKHNIDAIALIYKFGSDECGHLFWEGGIYRYEPCQSVY